jgi:hypothetical protein
MYSCSMDQESKVLSVQWTGGRPGYMARRAPSDAESPLSSSQSRREDFRYIFKHKKSANDTWSAPLVLLREAGTRGMHCIPVSLSVSPRLSYRRPKSQQTGASTICFPRLVAVIISDKHG